MELKGELLKLFKEIEHGDKEHRDWLYNKMFEFQNRNKKNKTTLICNHKNIKEHLCMPRYDECLDCGKTWGL